MARKKTQAGSVEIVEQGEVDVEEQDLSTSPPEPLDGDESPEPEERPDEWGPDDIATIPPGPSRHDYDAETVRMLAAHRRQIIQAREKYLNAAELAKSKKKALEHLQEDLEELIRQRTEELPLFDKPKAAASEDDAWGADPIAVLAAHDCPPATIVKLEDADIRTLGDLADWTNAGKTLADIPGIGEATATRIDDALADYWADRSAALEAAREAVEAEGDDEDPDSPAAEG